MIKLKKELIFEAAKSRPEGYLEAVRLAAKESGDEYVLAEADYHAIRRRFSPPTLLEQAAGVVGAAAAEAAAYVSGREPVNADEKSRRLAICGGCEFWISDSRRCSKCGCFMDVKAGWRSAKCPVGKW